MSKLWETEELARYLCGLPDDDEDTDLDDALYEKFDVDLSGFHKIVSALLPMATEGRSPFTDTMYQGFADRTQGLFLVKQPVA